MDWTWLGSAELAGWEGLQQSVEVSLLAASALHLLCGFVAQDNREPWRHPSQQAAVLHMLQQRQGQMLWQLLLAVTDFLSCRRLPSLPFHVIKRAIELLGLLPYPAAHADAEEVITRLREGLVCCLDVHPRAADEQPAERRRLYLLVSALPPPFLPPASCCSPRTHCYASTHTRSHTRPLAYTATHTTP